MCDMCVSVCLHLHVLKESVLQAESWRRQGLGGQDCWREGFGLRAWAEKSWDHPLGPDERRCQGSVNVPCCSSTVTLLYGRG